MIKYRGYKIEPDTLWGWIFEHNDYDGAIDSNDGRCGACETLRDCLNRIDDYIADDIFCDACDSTGIDSNSKYGDTCLHCHDARERQGSNTEYPETCIVCQTTMIENYPNSGKEYMHCPKCER